MTWAPGREPAGLGPEAGRLSPDGRRTTDPPAWAAGLPDRLADGVSGRSRRLDFKSPRKMVRACIYFGGDSCIGQLTIDAL